MRKCVSDEPDFHKFFACKWHDCEKCGVSFRFEFGYYVITDCFIAVDYIYTYAYYCSTCVETHKIIAALS